MGGIFQGIEEAGKVGKTGLELSEAGGKLLQETQEGRRLVGALAKGLEAGERLLAPVTEAAEKYKPIKDLIRSTAATRAALANLEVLKLPLWQRAAAVRAVAHYATEVASGQAETAGARAALANVEVLKMPMWQETIGRIASNLDSKTVQKLAAEQLAIEGSPVAQANVRLIEFSKLKGFPLTSVETTSRPAPFPGTSSGFRLQPLSDSASPRVPAFENVTTGFGAVRKPEGLSTGFGRIGTTRMVGVDIATAKTQEVIGPLQSSGLIKDADGIEHQVASNFPGSTSQEYTTNANLAVIRSPTVMRFGGRPTMTHMTFDDASPLGRTYTANINKSAAVVRLDHTGVTRFSGGSGVTVRNDGMVLGSYHTVADPAVQGNIFVKLGSHPVPYQGRIVAFNRESDLVLIKPMAPLGHPVPFVHPSGFADSVARGARVFTVGAPDIQAMPGGIVPHITSTMHLAEGQIISLDEVRHLNGPKVPMYRSTIPEAFQGMSGGATYVEGSGEYAGALQSRHDPSRDLSGLRGSKDDWTALTPGYIARNFLVSNYHR
jgi:hypothetical protein